MSTGGFADIVDDDWSRLDELGATEKVVGWLIILGTEEDAGRYILKTMRCNREGKLRQQEQEISTDTRMPNFIHKTTFEFLQRAVAALSIAHVGDPVIGVGQKIADDVYWIEVSYAKTLND